MNLIKQLPAEIEDYRDRKWQREEEARVESAPDAERMVERLGFCQTLTDARQPGASLYVAVCGRRDAHLPRNVQRDPESSLAWRIKDDVLRRGRVYYGKLARGRAMFVAPRMIPHFNAVWGAVRRDESKRLSTEARAILKVLRSEWEMGTADLRRESGTTDRAKFMRALDELQRTMKVIPGEVLYAPTFTYIWTLAEARFAAELSQRVKRADALREIARAFLDGAGLTLCGELAKAAGLTRPEAGIGNHALVDEDYAVRLARGVYRLASFELEI